MLFPDCYYNSTYEIPFEDYYKKGFRGIVFDIDNTLVPHGAPATKEAVDFIRRLKEIGFKVSIISNNTEERVKPFADAVGSAYAAHASKPLKKGYFEAMQKMGTTPENTIFVGDQIYTDILGGNMAGMHTLLVKPIKDDPDLWIKVKRKLELPVISLYRIKAKKKY